MKKKNKKIEAAEQSLAEIMRIIGPYKPKLQKSEKKEERHWQIVGNGALPPINSVPS